MSSTTDWSSAPWATASLAALYTYGQLTMNDPESLWNVDLDSSSPAVDMSAGAADERPSVPTISAALSPAGDATVGVASAPSSAFSMICPPSELMRALIHTM